jgi:hypothetical protein
MVVVVRSEAGCGLMISCNLPRGILSRTPPRRRRARNMQSNSTYPVTSRPSHGWNLVDFLVIPPAVGVL